MAVDPIEILRVLREEFREASVHQDGYFVDCHVNRSALLQEDGSVDNEILNAIEEAILEGHNISSDSEWYTGADSPDCFKEVTLCRWGHEDKIHELFDELSAGVMRCLFMIPPIVKKF